MTAAAPAAPKRFAVYVRVSTEKQLEGTDYTSLETQEDHCRRWVEARLGTVVRVYKDTESGTKLEARTGFMALLAGAEAGEFDAAVAYNADRWCRSVEIHILMKGIERKRGVRFLSTSQEFGTGPEAKLLETQVAAFNEYFSALVGAKVRLKRRSRAQRGEWNGGRAPFGYAKVDKKLVPDPNEAPVLRQMFALYAEHPSAAAVRNRLRAMGAKDRRGGEWSKTSIEHMLRNPIYCGRLREGGEVYPGIHEPLVPVEQWDVVQKLVPTRRRVGTKMERPYPLAGLIHCAACGTSMTPHYVKKGHHRYPRYRCTTTHKRGWDLCPVKEVNADKIERFVLEEVKKLAAEPALVEKALAAANESMDQRSTPLRAREAELERRASELRTRVANLTEAVAVGGASALLGLRDRLAAEDRDRRQIDSELAQVRAELTSLGGPPMDVDKAKRALQSFGLLFAAATPGERGELMRHLVRAVKVRGPGHEVLVDFYSTFTPDPTPGSISRTNWLPGLLAWRNTLRGPPAERSWCGQHFDPRPTRQEAAAHLARMLPADLVCPDPKKHPGWVASWHRSGQDEHDRDHAQSGHRGHQGPRKGWEGVAHRPGSSRGHTAAVRAPRARPRFYQGVRVA